MVMATMAPPRVPPPLAAAPSQQTAAKIDVAALNFYYGMRRALDGITLTIRSNEVTALIGPSGCGKSTFLRTLNRMNDIVPAARVEGAVTIDGRDIYALAVEPEILLMDEPASALDPIATQRIEELIYQLKARYTIVIVTHNMQQAARVSDVTAFFWLGRLVEAGRTDRIFTAPQEKLTE